MNTIYGYEIDTVHYNDCLERIVNWFYQEYQIKLSKDVFQNNLQNKDALYELYQTSNSKYDFCIGNPPYVQAKNLSKDTLEFIKKMNRQELQSLNFGKANLYYLFVELCYLKANDVCLIIPNSFKFNRSARYINQLISEKLSSKQKIIELRFQHEKVFDNADIYSCISSANIKGAGTLVWNFVWS